MSDAFQVGFDFFEGPQFDGHLRDRAPGETFDTKFGVTQMTYDAAVKAGIDVVSWDAIEEPEDVAPIYRPAVRRLPGWYWWILLLLPLALWLWWQPLQQWLHPAVTPVIAIPPKVEPAPPAVVVTAVATPSAVCG